VLGALPDDSIFVVMTYLDEHERRIEISDRKNRIDSCEKLLKQGGW